MTGADLRTVRSEWAMTQREMAAFLSYTEQRISKMERGEAAVPEIVEKLICRERKLRCIKNLLKTP